MSDKDDIENFSPEAFDDDMDEFATPSSEESLSSTIDTLPLKDVPLKIQLEVGRFKTTLEELQNMQPGQKLPVDINPWLIDLVINDKAIGKGELVEIGGAVGVKILEIYR